MNMKKKLLSVLAAGCLLALTLTACGGGETPAPTGSGEEKPLTKVVVSEFRHMNWAPVYIAQANGYFEEEGLDVEWALYDDGPVAFQGMHVGDSQFCLLSQEPVLKAQKEGLRSTFVYTMLDTRLYSFVGRPEIQSVQDLKGKVIFAGMPGSAPYSFVSSILRENGLDPEKDVTFINMDYGASLAALQSGQIQASYISADNRPEVAKMEANVLVDTADPADAEKYLKSDIFPGEIICTTEKYAKENPETVQAFVNAVSRAVEWTHTHSGEEAAKLLMPYFQGMDEATLAEKVEIVKKALTKTGYIGEAPEMAVQDFCISNGVITEHLPYADMVDMTFVDHVQGQK